MPRHRVGRDAARFIRRSRVAILGTTSAGDMPFATPLWFVRDRGVFFLTSALDSWAARNTGHHPEVTVLFGGERGRADRRRMSVEGTAVVRPGMPPLRVLARQARRYYLPPKRARVELGHLRQWPLRCQYYGQGSAAYLEITATRACFLPPL